MIGLLGAHRVGKTTLAKAYAEKHKISFLETNVGGIMAKYGFKFREPMTFDKRLDMQETVLMEVTQLYKGAPGNSITDRTPLDFIAYTMAEVTGESVPAELEERYERFINECYAITNYFFSVLTLVQPGIPVVDEPGKASLSLAYREHLNTIFLGILASERVKVAHWHYRRETLDLETRVQNLANCKAKAMLGLVRPQDLLVGADIRVRH